VQKFLTLFLTGAVSGAVYSLVAAGLVVSYSASGTFNFGHGAVAFASAFVYYQLHSGLHWPIVPAAFATVGVFAPLLGFTLDRLIFRRLATAPDSTRIMATIGVLVAVPAICLWSLERAQTVFHWHLPSVDTVVLPPGVGPAPPHNYTVTKGVTLDTNQLSILLAAAVASVLLWVVLRHTRLGLRMRASVDRPALAALRGVDNGRSSSAAWILGVTLAGIAGVVGAPVFNSLTPATYNLILFVAATAAVIGGLRSLPIAFVGGLFLGVAQNLVAGYASFASRIHGFNSSVPFVLLLVALVVLGRDRARLAGSAAESAPPPDHLSELPPWRRRWPWAAGTAALLVYLLYLADPFWTGLVTKGLAFALIFLSFVVVTGIGGMVSLAQAAFVTSAALTAGLLLSHGVPFPVALLGGVGVAVGLGVVVALPALRLGGLSLALATLALAFLGDRVLFQWDAFRNRQQGWTMHRPAIGPIHFAHDRTMAVGLLIVVGLATLVIRNLQRSPSGRAMVALRSSQTAAAASGVRPVTVKLSLFALSAAIAGVGGVLLGTVNGNVTNTSTPAELGLLWLASVVLFGIRRPGGAVLAGLSTAMFPHVVSGGFHWPSFVPTFLAWNGTKSTWVASILFGLGAVQMARSPDGILALVAARGHARRAQQRQRAEIRARSAGDEAAIDAQVARHGHELVTEGVLRAGAAGASAGAVLPAGAGVPAGAGGGHLSLRGIRAGYDDIEVLHGVDLDIIPGTITALLGANGAGKSTLCAVIAGQVIPTEGTIAVDGHEIGSRPVHQRFTSGVVLAPEGRGIFPGLTVDENLALVLPATGRDEVYHRFPLLGQRRRLPAGNLSGGEQQMLALAGMLVRSPKILVADEPTLGLAPLVIRQVMEVFGELRQRGTAILVVEEKVRDALTIADQVAFLELGHIVWRGPRSAIDDDRLTAVYLG
jgi:ABC-type branched-subunit amino acid transport system ATPase component/branched-subunit amino acid ABC-type transport system permease component